MVCSPLCLCAGCTLQEELFASFEQIMALADKRGQPYARWAVTAQRGGGRMQVRGLCIEQLAFRDDAHVREEGGWWAGPKHAQALQVVIPSAACWPLMRVFEA
jgi:hypothetical protein